MNFMPLLLQRCSPGPPPDMEDQPVIKNKGDDAWEALKAEMVDMFRPLLRNIAEFCSLRRPYDHEDYQIGMVFGAFEFQLNDSVICSLFKLLSYSHYMDYVYLQVHFLDVLAVTNCGRRFLPFLLMSCLPTYSINSVLYHQTCINATSQTA